MGDLTSTPELITPLTLDITSPESILAAHQAVKLKCGGKIYVIFHNAGYRSLAMVIEATYAESLRMLATSLVGVIELNRIFSNMIIEAKGTMTFTSSPSAVMPQPPQSIYCATKAALDLYVRTFRIEMQPFEVNVVLVHTEGVRTGMTRSSLVIEDGLTKSRIMWAFALTKPLIVIGSWYIYLAPKINKVNADLEACYMDPGDFARVVVGKLTSGFCAPTDIWSGRGALLV